MNEVEGALQCLHLMAVTGTLARVRDIHFSDLRFVEADIGFHAGTPTIIRLEISITRAKQACEFPAAHTVVHFVLLLPSGAPSENPLWTLPGIHPTHDPRML